MFKLNKIVKNIAFVFGVFALSFSLNYAVLAVWQEPLLTPPDGNVDAPLNTGATGQTKLGGLMLNTNGAPNGLIIDKGNVGIGIASPAAKLHLVGNSNTDLASDNILMETVSQNADNSANIWGMRARGLTNSAPAPVQSNDELLEFDGLGYVNATDGYMHAATISVYTDGSYTGAYLPGKIIFNTTSPTGYRSPANPQMILKSNGNIGIGTAAPEFKLSLDGDGGIFAKGAFNSGATLTATGYFPRLIWYPRKAAFRAGIADTEWNNANIGNYSFATGYLTMASGEYSTALGHQTIASGMDSSALGSSTTASGNYSVAMGNASIASGSGTISLGTSSSATGTQSIAVGTASEATGNWSIAIGGGFSKATAYGAMSFGQSLNANAENSMVIGRGLSNIDYLTNTIQNSLMIGFYSDIPTLFIGPSAGAGTTGNVGIGTAAPSEKLDVNGNVKAAAFLYSSDERLKNNIQNLDNSLAKILKLDGVSYTWKDSGEKGIGFTAQNVETMFPELVKTDEMSGMKSVEYGNLVAPLIEAVKEQQKMIEEQQKEIDALKAVINK